MCIPCEAAKRALNKGINIVTGYTNLLIPDADVELMALSRLKDYYVCDKRYVILTVGDKVVIGCGKCKCPVEVKTRVPNESCPLNKW